MQSLYAHNKARPYNSDSDMHNTGSDLELGVLGLAELVLWPLELTVMERATCVANITYDEHQRVESVSMAKKDGLQGC